MKRKEVIKEIQKTIEKSEKIDEYEKGKNISACGHCTGCQGRNNYYEKTEQYKNFTVEENSCYKRILYDNEGKEIGYFDDDDNNNFESEKLTLEELQKFLEAIKSAN